MKIVSIHLLDCLPFIVQATVPDEGLAMEIGVGHLLVSMVLLLYIC